MSFQGVQPKLSAVLKPKEGRFEIVDCGGQFILKPNPPPFKEVPANEALTMTLAEIGGLEVPPHGLVPASDGSWAYFVRLILHALDDARESWELKIQNSYLSAPAKDGYLEILSERRSRLFG